MFLLVNHRELRFFNKNNSFVTFVSENRTEMIPTFKDFTTKLQVFVRKKGSLNSKMAHTLYVLDDLSYKSSTIRLFKNLNPKSHVSV